MSIDKLINKLNICIGGKTPSEEERELFFEFLHNLKCSKRICYVFRGDENIFDHYNLNPICDLHLLPDFVFMIGVKAKEFLKERIVDDGVSILVFIWNRMHDKVCKLDFKNENTKAAVASFLERNGQIREYFANRDNKGRFISYKDTPNKEKVIDYYLSLLHTIGNSGDGNKSFFLSSSSDYAVGDKFKGNGIILYGWVPRNKIYKNTISYENINKQNDYIKSLGLPTYNYPMYYNQKEICLKYGLLPHFIIGYQYGNDFYINPLTIESWHDEIIDSGLDIDQSEFEKFLSKSNYKSSYIFIDGFYHIIKV